MVVLRAVETVCPVRRAAWVAFLARQADAAALPLHPVSDWSAEWAGQTAGLMPQVPAAARPARAAHPVQEAGLAVVQARRASGLWQAGLPAKPWQAWDAA